MVFIKIRFRFATFRTTFDSFCHYYRWGATVRTELGHLSRRQPDAPNSLSVIVKYKFSVGTLSSEGPF